MSSPSFPGSTSEIPLPPSEGDIPLPFEGSCTTADLVLGTVEVTSGPDAPPLGLTKADFRAGNNFDGLNSGLIQNSSQVTSRTPLYAAPSAEAQAFAYYGNFGAVYPTASPPLSGYPSCYVPILGATPDQRSPQLGAFAQQLISYQEQLIRNTQIRDQVTNGSSLQHNQDGNGVLSYGELSNVDDNDEEEHDEDEEDPTVLKGQRGTKASNILPIWGNEKTMNLNPLVLTNIQNSPYFKVNLYALKTYHEVIDEVWYQVKHLEPWEKGSRRVSGQTGMCGSVRGVGAGGIVSTPFCILYKFYTLRLTRKQLVGLLKHKDSPFIRALGFMYVRYTQPPEHLWSWFENYLDDLEEVDVKAGGGQVMTIGQIVKHMLTKLDWFSTLFPRIPVPIQKEIETKMNEYERGRRECVEEYEVVQGNECYNGEHGVENEDIEEGEIMSAYGGGQDKKEASRRDESRCKETSARSREHDRANGSTRRTRSRSRERKRRGNSRSRSKSREDRGRFHRGSDKNRHGKDSRHHRHHSYRN